MKIAFCRSKTIGSFIIRLLTGSKWSHVAIMVNDYNCIEAVAKGVSWSTIEWLHREHDVVEIREVGGELTVEKRSWLLDQLGKPYDFSALIAPLYPNRNWCENDSWFCSELAAKVIGGFIDNSRVTPQMLYLISKPV